MHLFALAHCIGLMLAVLSVPLAFVECFHVLEVGHDDRDHVVLKRVAVNETFLNEWRLAENSLDLFRSDVFSLRQLENILCAIDDLH